MAVEHLSDLVLMDIQLPDIDGTTALTEIRAHPLARKIPVFAITASVMPRDKKRIEASGFDAFISEPLNEKSFVETVARFAPMRKQLREFRE